MSVQIGVNCNVYYSTASPRTAWAASPTNGIYVGAAPVTLTPWPLIRTVNLKIDDGEADVSNRSSTWKLIVQALSDGGAEFDVPWTAQSGDPGLQAFLSAKLTRTSLAVLILDGLIATSGAQGLWADVACFGMTRDEPIDNAVMGKLKINATPASVPPQWVQI